MAGEIANARTFIKREQTVRSDDKFYIYSNILHCCNWYLKTSSKETNHTLFVLFLSFLQQI